MRNLLLRRHWAYWLFALAWAGPLSSYAQQTIGGNLVTNGTFSTQPAGAVAAGTDIAGWNSSQPYQGNNLYPAEGSLSGQGGTGNPSGNVNYSGGTVIQGPFPGDPGNNVAAASTWLLYNGTTAGYPLFWRQTIALTAGYAYRFSFYASNATAPGITGRALPNMGIYVQYNNGNGYAVLANNLSPAEEANGVDTWTRYQGTLSGDNTRAIIASANNNGTNNAIFNIYDNTNTTTAVGGDVAITAIALQRINQVPRGQQTAPTVFGRQGPVAIPTLRAEDPDADGSVVSYQITVLPPASQGTLLLNGSPVRVNQVLTTTEAASLSFDPNTGFSGNGLFTYTATDNLGEESLPLNYGIPINNSACNTQSTFKFSDRPLNESWTTSQNATVDGVTITSSGYTTSAGAVTFQISDQTGIDPGNAQPGKGLTWIANYSTASANTALTNRSSTVKFAFTDAAAGSARYLRNFTMVVGDLDRSVALGGDINNNGNGGFIDRMIFNGTDVNGNTVTLSAADVATAPNVNTFTGTSSYVGPVAANSVTGIGQSGSPAGNLIVSFPVPVKDITVTYTNLDPQADPANQAVTLLYLTWCGEADLNTTISGPLTAAAGQTVYYYATTTNTGPRPATNEVTTITLPGKPAANTVNAPNGTYNQATGVVTFNPVASLAVGASAVNYVSFVMPTGVTSFTGSAASSALEVDNNPADNNGTATAANITTTVGATGATGAALACPPNTSLGKDGTVTTATAPNTYYLPSAGAAANQKIIGLSATYLTGTNGSTGGTGLVAGDLVMIVQMQGGTINTNDNDTYGDGVAGPSGNGTTARVAGLYEYGVVASAPAIGVVGNLTLRDNLVNTYYQTDASTTAGQQRYQVIRIPQYIALTLNGTMSPPAYNGQLGGVLALDVAGPVNFNGNQIDATGKGFRGGAGRLLQGAANQSNIAYRTSAGVNVNGTKGEGTAGTPRYINANGTFVDTRTTTTGYPTILPAGLTDGYPSGDNGRGAPGTAGGGGTDGETGANQWNSGGAGGANGGRGGRGGNSFNNNLPVGGEPGAAFPNASSSRLVLGGGGGSGTTNDGSGTPGTGSTGAANPGGFSSSGASGGGMVLLRVGFVQGAGTIVANGANANNTTNQDGGGGGGAGGSILVTANGTNTLGGLTLTANGGTGGNTNPAAVNASGHGPGGGGGAGIVFANAPVASATAQPGTNGLSTANNGTVAFGAEPGTVGIVSTVISNTIAGSDADASCVSDLTTTITGPLTVAAGGVVNLTASFGNLGGLAGQNVTRAVTLPATVAATSAGITAPGATITGGGLNPYVLTYPTLGTLAPGASNSYSISYTAPATGGVTSVQANSAIGPQGNTATNPDVYVANNTSSVTTTVVVQADVTTSITGPALVAPGTATGAFTATFTNNGPSQALNVTRTVTLPAGATITAAQLATLPTGTSYSGGNGGTLTFPALNTLNAGATSTVSFPITASVTPGAAAIQSNVGTTTPQGTNVRPDQATFNFTVATLADVAATINNNNAGTITAGNTATFVATFSNNGPSTAANVVPTVQLPAGLSGVAATNGGTYNATTGLVSYPAIASGATGTLLTSNITFTMPGVPVAASAAVNTDSNEGNLTANNTATASINSASTFDVTTRLTGPGTAAPGTSVTFDVLTINSGPGIAPNVAQSVTIPGVFTSLFASNGGTYSNNGTNTTVTFPAIAGLASGANVNNTITLTMPAAGITNATATVAATGDSNSNNNTSQASVTASTAGTGNTNLYTTISPALGATPATTLTAPVAPGTDVVFNVTIGNYGPTAATNAVTRVALPAGLSGVVPSANGTYNATTGVVTFPATSLPQGSTVNYTITLPAPMIAGPLVAVSSVASDMAETVPDDNVATTKIGITPLVDVATTLVGPTGPTTGQTATYAVTTTNNGPTTAYGVAQQVLLPLGLSNVSVSATVGGPAITLPTGAYNPATGVLTLPAAAVPATLVPGASALNFVSFTTPNSSSYPVTAAVSTTSQETNVANNAATVVSTTNPATDVSVTLTGPGNAAANTNNVPQGNPITYTVTTTNNGSVIDPTTSVSPSSATTVQLPAGLANVTVSGGGSYNSSTGLVTFPPITFQALGAAGAVTNTITFTAPSVSTTPIVATAQVAVAPSGSDPILTNNSATVVTNITNASSANLIDESTTITATVGGSPASTSNPAIAGTGGTGNSVVFTVTSTNNTMSPAYTATGLVQQVQLPANLNTADVVLSTGGSYDPATGIVTFSTPTSQANGLSNTYTITLNNIPGGLSSLVATAIVTTDNSDSNPNNNTQSVTVPVSQRADLVTTVSGPTSANPSSPATYLVTTRNIGPSTASSVATTVQLPTGLTGVVVSGGGSYDPNSGVVTFPTAAYLPGYSGSTAANNAVPQVAYTITLTTPETISLTAGFNVTATSATGTAEVTTGNNSATVTTFGPNLPPTALNVVNQLQNPQGNTAGALPISPLVGTDPENAIATYQLTSIPPTTQGVLFYNNNADGVSGTNVALTSANFASLNLTPAQAQNLKFDPGVTYSGNVFFNYTVTDQANLVSPVALYTIPVNNDVPALYTVSPPKSSATFPYNNGDVLATVVDANGATYNTSSVLTNNGLVSAVLSNSSAPLPAGTALNPTTGQITVSDRTQLVPGSYPLTITTTDAYGGVTVNTITLVIGGSPIAVDDFATTPLNTAVTFPVSANDLANFGAAIDPATIDLDPATAGIQTSFTTAQGTFTTVGVTTGSVKFTPASATFTGTATTPYTINNSASPAGTSNQANLVVTVRGNLPVDLATAITVGGAASATVNAGASTTLNGIAATNNGTTAATSVVQTVTIPTNLTTTNFTVGGVAGTLGGGGIITFGTNGPTYSQTTGVVTYPPTASIAAGATQTYGDIVFPAPASSFVAVAQVGNGTTDPTPANNVASVPVTVTPQFDLQTTLTGPVSGTVVSGDLYVLTVTSRNAGPSTVGNALQRVTIGSGLTGVFVTGGGFYNAAASNTTVFYANGMFTTTNPGGNPTLYSVAPGQVIFPPMVLANSQAVANTISYAPTTAPSATAVIAPNTTLLGDTDTSNNTASLSATLATAVAGTANAYVTLTGPATATAGNTVSYSLTQGNRGQNSATSVTTSVSLPTGLMGGLGAGNLTLSGGVTSVTTTAAGYTFNGGTFNGATYNTSTGVLTLPTLTTQGSAATPQSATIGLPAPATGTYNVTATVATTNTDPVPGDNVASVMTTVAPTVDVAVSLTGPTTATAGQPVNYLATTSNGTGQPANSVTTTVSLPANLTTTDLRVGGQTGTVSGTNISFANGASYNTQNGVLTLATIGALPANTSQSTAITFPAPGTVSTMSLTAAVSTTSVETALTNNRSTLATTLAANSDVTVAIAGPTSVTVGNLVTYMATTANNGPSVAASTTPTMQLPDGLSNVVVRDNTGAVVANAYNAATGLVTFPTISNLLPGAANAQTGTVTFTAPSTTRLDVAAVATVPASNGDSNLDNNRAAIAATTVSLLGTTTTVDVAVTLTPDNTTVTAGSPVAYTLTTQNNTAGVAANNVTRQVSLPAGLTTSTLALNGTTGTTVSGTGVITFTGGPNDGTTYNQGTGVLTLPTLATLNNGTPVTTTITVTPANGPVVASASVAAANTESNTANNFAQATNVAVTPRTDVATYLNAPATAAAGSTVAYTVVTANNGPSNVGSLTQTVVLPANATGITAPAGATITGTTVTFPVTNLASGTSQSNVVSFTMPNAATAAGTASVPTTNDANTANNTAAASTSLPNQAPVAQDVVNALQSPQGNTAGALRISPLAATDADGTVQTYQLTSLPTTTQGVLYYNNNTDGTSGTFVALPVGQALTQTQANTLRFDPASTFAGSVYFGYTATDNVGTVSQPARYTIQSGVDNNSVYAGTPSKGGANAYANNDVLAYVIDPNGGSYTSGGLVYATSGTTANILQSGANNGVASAVRNTGANTGPATASGNYPANPNNDLPTGTAFDPATGLIYVSDRTLLPKVTTTTYYQVNVITTDLNGGVNTVVAQFMLGAYPLPVTLVAFTAQAVSNRDGLLKWTTASEANNDHFELERSLDGTSYVNIGQLAGQGSKATATDYSFTDAGVAAKVAAGRPVYYRLKQVDTDGTSTYSPVRTLSFTEAAGVVTLFPNPAATATSLDLRSLPLGNTYQATLLDAAGRQVRQLTLTGGQVQELTLSDVASGTYQVLVSGQQANGSALKQVLRLIKE